MTGKVTSQLSLTYDELRGLPKVTATPTLVCPGFFEDTATWSGVPLPGDPGHGRSAAGREEDLVMSAADGYGHDLSLEDALEPENFLAYEWRARHCRCLHGFPLRAVFPTSYGSYWVKWLVEIEVAVVARSSSGVHATTNGGDDEDPADTARVGSRSGPRGLLSDHGGVAGCGGSSIHRRLDDAAGLRRSGGD